jgi:hypothetical protein
MAMPHAPTIACPHCRQPLTLPDPLPAGFLTCPNCGGALILDSPSDQPPEAPPADELDGDRIRQLSRARRASIRSRSYAIIASTACAVTALQLCFLAWRNHHDSGAIVRPIAFGVLAVGAVYGCVHFARRARQIKRELSAPTLAPPPAEPDFSPLQDGSQRVDRLNEMR